ncbi:trypsin-like serine protease [Conidiobolus coronatus NRRL 28638]|uniref:Trypsin-like serine protease n=1 Tax=Conidiobolus coronatus (strain ATCC 28846 / CBS 209.66 / NRRL 28638) TaxID=796925 RepID=A0A137P4E1_CONC2|nr:trypsin-like serine protease [Conidiobolus coronatus NRRL 28638]|eukprot:KXN69890.1 trypsin-like serine protease [Conidiobolus coronatus NRRL 28638]
MSLSHSNQAQNPQTGQVVPPPRIVGGYDVSPAFKYPAFVSIQYKGKHDCGGTLWNDNTVITAAHCSQNPVSVSTVKVHRHDLSKTDKQEGGKTYSVVKKIVHPNYKDTDSGYDVAIWKLNTTQGYRTNVELDDGRYGNVDDTLLTAIGWGSTGNGPATSILQEVKVPVYNFEQCKKDYAQAGIYMTNWNTQLCAGYPKVRRIPAKGILEALYSLVNIISKYW